MSRWMDLMSKSADGAPSSAVSKQTHHSRGPDRGVRCANGARSIDAHHAQIVTMCVTVTLMVCKCGRNAALDGGRGGTGERPGRRKVSDGILFQRPMVYAPMKRVSYKDLDLTKSKNPSGL